MADTITICPSCDTELGVPDPWWWISHNADGSHTVHVGPVPESKDSGT